MINKNDLQKIGYDIGKLVMYNAEKDYKNSVADAEIDALKDNN